MKRLLALTVIFSVFDLVLPSVTLADKSHSISLTQNPVVQSRDKAELGRGSQINERTHSQIAEKRKKITSEALSAIEETQSALRWLDESKKDKALRALEQASGKLDLILARDPNLGLAPTNVSTETYDLYADIDKVKAAREEALRLLTKGKVPEAREILDTLRSETVISVSNIPLETYPEAIKNAVKQIDNGKIEEAKETLQTALDTLVVTDTVIPIPVTSAQDNLEEAETLSEKSDRSKEENKELSDLLEASRSNLKFAEALGYGTPEDFKDLYGELDAIEQKTNNGKSGKGFFDEIKSSLEKLFRSTQTINRSSAKS